MVSCTEFIPLYSELFKFLEKKNGKKEVIKYWEYVSDNYVQDLLGEEVEKNGLAGCFNYWGKSLNEENCDFTIIFDEDEETFEIRMYGCPSRGMINKLSYTNPYKDYCEHCSILYARVLEKYGIKGGMNESGSDYANCRCSELYYVDNHQKKPYAKITKIDTFGGIRLEIPNCKKMLEFITNANKDTPCGKYDFGDEGYINVIETTTDEVEVGEFEAHRDYYDIQCLLDGEEKIYYTMLENLEITSEYDKKIDILFGVVKGCKGKIKCITYKSGEAISIPNETAHAPCYAVEKSQKVKKAIIKVKL